MSYDVYWVKNRAEKIADFEHPTLRGTIWVEVRTYPQLRCFAACSGFHDIGPAPRNPQLIRLAFFSICLVHTSSCNLVFFFVFSACAFRERQKPLIHLWHIWA